MNGPTATQPLDYTVNMLNDKNTERVRKFTMNAIERDGTEKPRKFLGAMTENIYQSLATGDHGRGDVRRLIVSILDAEDNDDSTEHHFGMQNAEDY